MQLGTFNTLGTALQESALEENNRGNSAEWNYLIKLFTDLQLTELRFRRIRLKYFDYLDRRDGIRRKLRAAPSSAAQNCGTGNLSQSRSQQQ